jgi:diaminohydroxyphosphoribosylaminopyrimidine deaminase/5-amino-6-(5-phosphoribosylamino)uracil reductase
MDSERHEQLMALALSLAGRGCAATQPNPMVGAVIVKDGEIVGEGYHERYGEEHAEVNAIARAGERARGGTLYLNLEPCNHHGKTPPCTEAVLRAGITRVVCADTDPNPITSGQGYARLRAAGVTVIEGVLRGKARELNEKYYRYVTGRRPWVTLKLARSLDGKMTTGEGSERRWLTGELSRRRVHEMRACHMAVMVGRKTVEKDDPSLSVRCGAYLRECRQPTRVIVDSLLSTDPGRSVARTADRVPTIVYAITGADPERAAALEDRGVDVVTFPEKSRAGNRRVDLESVMTDLRERDIASVLVEGGRELSMTLLDLGLVDRLVLFVAPIIVGEWGGVTGLGSAEGRVKTPIPLRDTRCEQVGDDIMITGRFRQEESEDCSRESSRK